ncbi:MAG: hypothetical protein HGA85_03980 [Nanoarchaeota archaeon]|nr:hypothetical protein [Nanoarchaeota archaeon]
MEKISYRFNPYTFARISAMKSLLLKQEDYDKLMKMSLPEITKYLQEGVYKDEINTLAMKMQGLKLLENSLNMHLSKIFIKLRMISDDSTKLLMDQYLKRYDFWNLKTLLRSKVTGTDPDIVLEMLLPVGGLKKDALKRLAFKKTAREIIESCGIISAEPFRPAIEKFEKSQDLSEIENLLDKHYYEDTTAFAEKIPAEGKLFREFFLYEFDIYNVNLMMKKIAFKLLKKDIEPYLIYSGKEIKPALLKELNSKSTFPEFLKTLSKTSYGKELGDLKPTEDVPLLRYEVLLTSVLLKKSMLLYHQHPLTVDMVLGYMFAKDIEVRNLRAIIKSRALEFTDDYVKKIIVTG